MVLYSHERAALHDVRVRVHSCDCPLACVCCEHVSHYVCLYMCVDVFLSMCVRVSLCA